MNGPLRVGLTGGIGSGKSTVAAAFVALGLTLVDTDAIARQLTLPGGAAIAPIRQTFGHDAIDESGALDRAWMRERAFSDSGHRRALEAILHPLIGDQARREALAARGPVLYDVPLMNAASAWRRLCDRIVVVDCDADEQVRRVMQRSGWSEAQVRAVVAQQLPREARRAIADAVIHNQGLSIQALQGEVAALHALWLTGSAEAL